MLAAQARPQEWVDALEASWHSRTSTDGVETAQTSAGVMAETAQVIQGRHETAKSCGKVVLVCVRGKLTLCCSAQLIRMPAASYAMLV